MIVYLIFKMRLSDYSVAVVKPSQSSLSHRRVRQAFAEFPKPSQSSWQLGMKKGRAATEFEFTVSDAKLLSQNANDLPVP